MRTHTADKPHTSSECHKDFSKTHNLVRHERTQTGERPFSYSYGCQNFGQKQHLQEHEKMHTSKEKCSVCEEIFKNPNDLLEDMMDHPVDPDSICNSVLTSFIVQSSLKEVF